MFGAFAIAGFAIGSIIPQDYPAYPPLTPDAPGILNEADAIPVGHFDVTTDPNSGTLPIAEEDETGSWIPG